jgi:hypothetical protein
VLQQALFDADNILWDFRFGANESFSFHESQADIPAPPNQAVADELFATLDVWDPAKVVLQGEATPTKLSDLVGIATASVFNLGDGVVRAFAAVVAAGGVDIPYAQMAFTSTQLAFVQSMSTQAMWIVHGLVSDTSTLAAAMATYAQVGSDLDKLFGARRLAGAAGGSKNLASESADGLLSAVQSAWEGLKPLLDSVVENKSFGTGGEPSDKMYEFVHKVEDVTGAIDNSLFYFGHTTRTTTLAAVGILAPIPLSGTWAGGRTMRVAALMAEKLINDDHLILEGYDIRHTFFDDHCDGRETARIVLEEMNKDDTYVALGGVGCSRCCAESTFVASSLRLPFVGYDCPAPTLSSVAAYPGLTRLGTVTISDTMFDALQSIGQNNSWSHVRIISGDLAEEREQATLSQNFLDERGFSTEIILGIASDFEQLTGIFASMKENTRGKQRNVLVVGDESFYRKLLCAAIKAEAKEGITWISQGSWRDGWWNRTDTAFGFQTSWLHEEADSARIQAAFHDFETGWDAFAADDDARSAALMPLYSTDAGLDLYSIPGKELYHEAHTQWHSTYHQLLFQRQYYDIIFFDLRGNLIYSVNKEKDYGTNFATGQYSHTGLGQAFEAALAEPDVDHYIDWESYEASGYGALAAFLATGIKNSTGHTVGIYVVRLPPGFEQSIDQIENEDCNLEALAKSFEGSINIAGLGKPLEESMDKPLACFKGHSAESFFFELDGYLRDGFPGVPNSAVKDPYNLVRGNAADATCLVAYTLKYLLSRGHSLEEIQNPNEQTFSDMQDYIKTFNFDGVTGHVEFYGGNDKPNNLVVQQVQNGMYVEVGILAEHYNKATSKIEPGNQTWINGGVSNAAWKLEHIDPPPPKAEEFDVFLEVILPFFFVIIPILLLLALSPLLFLVMIWIFKTCAGRVQTDGSDGGSRA